MRLNLSPCLLLLLGGCSGAELTEPWMPPPSRDWGHEDALREAEEARSDQPPIAVIVAPREGTRYRVGDALSFEGRGRDPEDGGLRASAFTWRVDFHEGGRVYPFVPPISGMGRGMFTVPSRPETDGPRWYRISLQLRDSQGNTHTVYRDVYPQDPAEHRSALVR
jgi:hypothetical protein